MKRRWRIAWTVGASLLVVTVLLTLVLLKNDWAFQRIVRTALPAGITIEDIDGDLTGPIGLAGIAVEQPGLSVSVDRLSFRWKPSALFSKTVHVVDLELGTVDVTTSPTQNPEPESTEPFELPPDLDFGIDVLINRLAVSSIVVNSGGEQPTRVDGAALQASLVGGELNVERFRADIEENGLSLSGRVNSKDDYRHDLVLRVLQASQPPVEAIVKGTLTSTNISVEAPGFDTQVDLDVNALLTEPAWTLRARVGNLTRIAPVTDARLESSGSLREFVASGQATIDGRVIELQQAELSQTDGVWTLSPIRVVLPDDGAQASIVGTVSPDRAGGPIELRVELDYEPRAASAAFDVTGQMTDYRLVGEFQLDDETAKGALVAQGTAESIDLQDLRVEALDGLAKLSGRAEWGDAIAWQAEGLLTEFDPRALAPEWPGKLNAVLNASGTDQSFEVLLSELGGTLRERNVSGNLSARSNGSDPIDVDVNLASGASTIVGNASVGDAISGLLRLDVPNASDLYPGARGSLAGELEFRWADERLMADGDLKGADLEFEDFSLGDLDVTATPSGSDLRLSITATDLVASDQRIAGLQADYVGQVDAHTLRASVSAEGLDAVIGVDGGFANELYRGDLVDLSLEQSSTGRWALTEPAKVRYHTDGRLRLDPACLRQGDGELCAGVEWGEDTPNTIQVKANEVNLALIEPFVSAALDETVTVEGSLGGKVRMESVGSRWSLIDVDVAATPTTLAVGGYDEPVSLNALQLKASGDQQALALSGRVEVDASQIALTGDWARPFDDGDLDLQIDGVIPEFESYDALIPQLGDLVGQAAIDLNLKGPVSGLQPSGSLQIQSFGGEVLSLGLKLSKGEIVADWKGGDTAQINGSIMSGDGQMDIGGTLGLIEGAPVADLTIKGDSVRAVDLPSMQVSVSPNLRASINKERAKLTGSVTVPSANILLSGFGQGVSASSDVIVVDNDVEVVEESALPVFAEIDLLLGDDVNLQGFGLDADVTGKLRISEAPGRSTRGRGALRVTGEYAAYGQQLAIERGRILFSDTPIDNPALDIQAVRRPEGTDIVAGVRVQGRVSEPTLDVYSVPSMDQSEALSWLVLGRPLKNAGSGGDTDLLGAAALSLGMKGGNKIASSLGSSLGFSELGFSSNSELGGAAFSLGRYLSPKLYISYSVGLLESLDLVQLQYTINDKWAIESQVGEEAKGIVKYRIEKGR